MQQRLYLLENVFLEVLSRFMFASCSGKPERKVGEISDCSWFLCQSVSSATWCKTILIVIGSKSIVVSIFGNFLLHHVARALQWTPKIGTRKYGLWMPKG